MMKKTLVTFLVGLGLSGSLLAQSKIGLRLRFNAESNRYEVYANSNFTARKYAWGPSQISVVVPARVANAPISVRSNRAGLWLDQSAVYSPDANWNQDYHGFSSQGSKVDMLAGEEQLLFDFSLPQGYVDGVRLYDSKQDPGSTQAGMQGGDFRSYISDASGNRPVDINAKQAELTGAARVAIGEESALVEVVAYPNPSPAGLFRLYLKGFRADEVVRVQLSSLTGKALRQFEEPVATLAGRAIVLPGTTEGFVLVTVSRPGQQESYTRKVWVKE